MELKQKILKEIKRDYQRARLQLYSCYKYYEVLKECVGEAEIDDVRIDTRGAIADLHCLIASLDKLSQVLKKEDYLERFAEAFGYNAVEVIRLNEAEEAKERKTMTEAL